MNIAIVGCGLIGQKRARSLAGARLTACCDRQPECARALAELTGASVASDWPELIRRDDVEMVMVATTHDVLAEIAQAAVEAGKHVLVEKPAGRRAVELDPVIDAARRCQRLVRVGFNHRYHPAVIKARELVSAGLLGELMFVRGYYGHGGRPGYEREWRAQPEISGGGQLIDQGVHLIDLARCFLGDFVNVEGFVHTYYWNMPVEDNAFVTMRTARQQVAFLHASCTEWKNTFSLEIYGRTGKVAIAGLGGSYGTERVTFYRMLPQMGPPETTAWEYPIPDSSWGCELAEFLEDIRMVRQPAPGLMDAKAALSVVERVYEVCQR